MGTPADPGALSPRHGRSSDAERTALRARRRGDRRPGRASRRARCCLLVDQLLADGARRSAMGDAMRSLARPQAAEAIAEELISIARA